MTTRSTPTGQRQTVADYGDRQMGERRRTTIGTSNDSVISQWIKGEPWKNGSGSLTTDGNWLKSYNLVIGETFDDGMKVAYRPKTTTQTTRRHSNLAAAAADAVQEIL